MIVECIGAGCEVMTQTNRMTDFMKLRSNDYVTASTVVSDETEMVLMSDRYYFKRVKLSDIPSMNRATLGVLSSRKVKSNPHHIHAIYVGNIYDEVKLYSEKFETLAVKSIPLMDFEASYSQCVKITDFVICAPLIDVKLVDIPITHEISKEEPLKFDL